MLAITPKPIYVLRCTSTRTDLVQISGGEEERKFLERRDYPDIAYLRITREEARQWVSVRSTEIFSPPLRDSSRRKPRND